ncbi:surface polysaccharide O-acyltransferase-like enzyme [Marinobacter pelagius]|uniref:Surface polysaccharide O-acyltransferase-like enzyme n=1 Tax=Marinobacter pelagius TaxID=379482 RepID=A0A366GH23_9GAMM|nr:acyltransferase [Marinobacter pelagius]RBP25682.1 surface polysaccharide O-acyltransferase-like enzyme [Marinobacter pelagius]
METTSIKNIEFQDLSKSERVFIDRIRGLSIIRVVLVHLGLSWIYTPYSQFVHNLLPLLFFVSGAVSFYSLSRSNGFGLYLIKRLLSIVGPFYVIALSAMVVFWIYNYQFPTFNIKEIVRWLTIIPESSDTPFPMGQIWFVHAMVIIVLITVPFLVMARSSSLPLLFLIVLSIVLSVFHQAIGVSNNFSILGHNFYQGLVNVGFFVFGALYYKRLEFFDFKCLFGLLIVSITVALTNVFWLNVDVNMANHTYAPDTYYLSGSYSAIIFVLLLKRLINKILDNWSLADSVVLFFSKHAYSVFIVHSFSIYFLETKFGLVNVIDNPALAAVKVASVFIISAAISVPVTWVTNWVTGKAKEKIQSFFSQDLKGCDRLQSTRPLD